MPATLPFIQAQAAPWIAQLTFLPTDESRIQVSGSIGGNPASASNIYGSSNYVVGVHVIHTNFDDIVSLPPDLVDTEINGTAILNSSDTAGLISNASTGAGIPGVAVSDGYQVVVTDANGVYQMQRDSRSRKIYWQSLLCRVWFH